MNKQCQCCCSKCKAKKDSKERPPKITNGPAVKLWPSGEIMPDHVPAPPLLNIGAEQKRKTTFWGKWFR